MALRNFTNTRSENISEDHNYPVSGELSAPQSGCPAPIKLLASIMIVSYNSRAYLDICLKSVQANIGADCEIILIDNASNDDSADFVAETFRQVKLVRNPENLGFAAANNQAAKMASGTYLIGLNPDTEVTPGWLQALLEPLEKAPNQPETSLPVGLTTPRILMYKEKGRVNTCGNNMHFTGITVCQGLGLKAQDPQIARSSEVSAISGACFAINRILWHKLGGFDETFFTYLEDTDLSLRARLAGYCSFYVATSVIYHDYTDRFSPRKLYYLERNRLILLYKTYSPRLLFVFLPALLLTELVTWLYALKSGPKSSYAKLEAYGWFFTHLKNLGKKRQATQLLRGVGDRQLLKNILWKLDTSQLAGPYLSKMADYCLNPVYAACYYLGRFSASARFVTTDRGRQKSFSSSLTQEKKEKSPDRLRIAHVTATFPPYQGGTGNVCFNNALELAKLGHEVHIFTALLENTPEYEVMAGIYIHRLRPLMRLGNAPVLPGLMSSLRGFDLIHLHYPFFGGELTTVAAWISRTPLVITYHQDVLLKGWLALVEKGLRLTVSRLTLRFAARLFFTSLDYGEASYVKPLLKGRQNRVMALPNGVDTIRFEPGKASYSLQTRHGIGSADKVALLVASLDSAHYFKGINVFLEALTQLPANYKGLILGEGDRRGSYEETARNLGIESRIEFVGRVSDQLLPDYYRLANVTVLPSVSMGEAFGLVLVESMACGTPVIASNLPGVRTVVDDGKDGLLVKPNNPLQLANALKKLLEDDALSFALGSAGRQKVEKDYDWAHIAALLQNYYYQILEKNCRITVGGSK